MNRAVLLVLVAVLTTACAVTRTAGLASLPADARATPAHYVVVTIRNPPSVGPAIAASTKHSYEGARPYVAGRAALTDGRALAAEYGLQEVSSWPIALLGVHCIVYGIGADADAQGVTSRLRQDGRVESVQPLQAFQTEASAYNDPYAGLQQNVERMAIPEAHAVSRGAGVRVAIIDTGADVDHPDLGSHATSGGNFVDGDSRAFRADGHGTAVAGVIGAVPNNGVGIVGIAPAADLLIYKACWRSGAGGMASTCNSFTLAQALAAAIDARADVINLSLGGPSDPLLTRLVHRALESGAIVVGAVPRDGTRSGFPVEIDGVIAADASERTPPVAGVTRAPGRDVLSLTPGGHYDFFSGSSLAAAEISGLLALLLAERPHLSAREATTLLTTSAGEIGAVPNACAALAALRPRSRCESAVAGATVAERPTPARARAR